jgi:hypothetical protein
MFKDCMRDGRMRSKKINEVMKRTKNSAGNTLRSQRLRGHNFSSGGESINACDKYQKVLKAKE